VSYDLIVVGEPLLEFAGTEPLTSASTFTLSFSGDALNACAAAAAAGAKVALVTRLGDDELSDRLVAYLAGLNVGTALIRREAGQTGAYVLGADPGGTRGFAYLRAGSAASRLTPSDLDDAVLAGTGAVLLSGITAAISASAAETVAHAARTVHAAGGKVVYDPNFRPRLTSAAAAASFFATIAPHLSVAIPSSPADTTALFGTTDPAASAAACHALGVPVALITCGSNGTFLSVTPEASVSLPVVPATEIADSTGAGDSFAGTFAARYALGDALLDAARLGMAAASLSLAGVGGTGYVPDLATTRAHLAKHVD
jgi:2-dehydro-3-deoxygluconokinase